jgi:PAS domain S-box-containing protein
MLTSRWFKMWQNWTAKEKEPAEAVRRELEHKREALETAEETLAQRDLELSQAQGELDRERQRYRELFDLAPQAYVETDEFGLIRVANQAAAILLQKPVQFLTDVPLIVFVANSARSDFLEVLSNLRRRQGMQTQEYQLNMRPSDGRAIDAAITVRAVRNEEGIMSLHWMLNDITARKRVEVALKSAHESLLYHVKRQSAELEVVKATMVEEWEVRQRVEQQAMAESLALNHTVEERTAELAETHASLAQEIAERERAEREIVRRNQELATLNRVSSVLTGSLELPTVMRLIKELAAENLEVDGGLIYLYDQNEQQFWLYDSWGTNEDVEEQVQYLNASGLPIEAILQEKEMIFPELAALATNWFNWGSYLFLPLAAQNQAQGAICLFSMKPAVFGEVSRLFFENLGQQVAVAIQNARLYEQVSEGRERLRQLTQQMVNIQERERHRVSRELHDEAGQALTVLKFSLELVIRDLPVKGVNANEAASLRQRLTEVVNLCETTMARIRQLAHNLRPAALDDLGLNAALEGLCHDFGERTHLTIVYEGEEIGGLSGGIDISLYRFVQEALTNVLKHAQAENVWVRLSGDNEMITLSVQDDGRGFTAAFPIWTPKFGDGVGLAGVRERLQPLGGRLESHSAPGKGTRLVAYVPQRR